MGCCKIQQHTHQPYPQTGSLAKNINTTMKNLRQYMNTDSAHVYCYIVKSVKNKNGSLCQQGCGPNWQGGLITLCTCKHMMRTFRDLDTWWGTWIAGFTSVGAGRGRNALVYLMKVKDAFDSHHDMWYALPKQVRLAKAAHRKGNILGDVFRPKGKLRGDEKFLAGSYYEPCNSHAHGENDGWHKDVNYSKNSRRAALLVGEQTRSFLWSKPTIISKSRLYRGGKKVVLTDLYVDLYEA